MEITNDVRLVDMLFREILGKINRLENKKHLYKDIDDLTIIEINTLLVIGDGMKSMSEIAGLLGVTSGTPTVTIDRLITKGYVERIRDEVDRRQVFVKLSGKGLEVLQAVINLKRKVGQELFGILTQEEVQVMIKALSKINKKFDDLMRP